MKELREFLDKYNVKYTVESDTVIAGDINLSNKEISELPESIGNLKCNGLGLYNNQITELPESFGNIKCDYIYLDCNKISVLPESIGNLKCNTLDLSRNQIIELPESFGNIKCNYLWLGDNQITETPEYDKYKFNDNEITDSYINCDGLFSWFNSIKTIGEYTVYICYNNQYIVTKDNTTFAHGYSIRQAICDLIFKLSYRDKSNYINLDKDTELSIEQAIVMYRVITGACSSGVEGFLRNKDIPETVTVNYILNIIGDSDYGYKEFREFFNLK